MDAVTSQTMSLLPQRRRTGRWLRRLAPVVVVAVAAQLAVVTPTLAAPAYRKGQAWTPPHTPKPTTPGVPRGHQQGESATPGHVAAAAPAYRAPAYVPPTAGSQTLSLTAATASASGQPLLDRAAKPGRAEVPGAPVWVADSGKGTPSQVRVDVAAQDVAGRARVGSGLLFGVARADGVTAGGSVRVEVAPDALAGRFGGNYAQRLRLVQLPACALTTPDVQKCQTRTPLTTTVDPATGRLTADLPVPGGSAAAGATASPKSSTTAAAPMAVVAADSTPSGSTGTYAATSLKPSDQWSTGPVGNFNYTYPITTPPTLGGAAPNVALSYSSSDVDGMTASTNAQASWVGSGWTYNPGYIERSYQPCSDDGIANSGDTCWGWGGLEVTLDGQGMAGPLVHDDASGTWHLAADNGATIQLLTGANNGAYNGEYWVLTTQDGTRYYFGAGHLPSAEGGTGTDPASSAAWTQPVYCPHSGDPCYSSSSGTDSFTPNMAYRWNLDYVVDPHGNAVTYSYGTETNYYARGSSHTNTQYVRGGFLKQINYGWRAADVAAQASPTPAAEVVFSTVQRCTGSSSECSSLSNLNSTTAKDWPDTPYDQICQATGTCTNGGMSYFSTLELSQIQTLVNKAGTYKPVDTYALAHSFPDPLDGSSPSLWLDSVTHTGNDAATATSVPAVTFGGTGTTPNRVPGSGTWPAYNHPRIGTITTETGEQINISYTTTTATIPACDQTPSAPKLPSTTNNTWLCYQQYWAGQGQTTPNSDWFEKYVVNQVVAHDPVAGSPDKVTQYTYVGDAAWHRDDSVTTKNAQRSWNQFRGFGQVLTTTGDGKDGPVTQTATSYLRGMNGDYTSQTGGSQKSVTVSDSVGDQITDTNAYADAVLETDTYTGAGGSITSKQISLPWSAQTASHAETAQPGLPARTAAFVNTGTSKSVALLSTGAWRTAQTVNVYSASTGLLQQSDDQGDLSLVGTASSQETCATTSYATPPAGQNKGMVNYAARQTVVSVSGAAVGTNPCPAPTAANTVSDRLTYYDGNTTAGAIGSVGDVTQTASIDNYSGSTPAYTNDKSAGKYDVYGRPTSITDARGLVTTTAYTPATGQLATTIVSTDATFGFATTTTMDQARQLPTKTVDPNGNSTSEAYDGLGRLTSVWLPGRSTLKSASLVYGYSVNGTSSPSWTSTKTLRDDNTYGWAYTIVDGLGRARQTQTVSLDGSNGSLVTDTFYDSHGWTVKKTNPYYTTSFPSSTIYPAADASVPGENVTGYDGEGRTTSVTLYSYGQPQWTTVTAYPGTERTDVTPPAGGTATSTFTDALGRTSALWHYSTATPDGNAAHAQAISYTYYPNGKQATITGPGGQVWTYAYDLHGNPTTATDPDSGTTTTSYNAAGDLLSQTDSRPQTLSWNYDKLGRKTAEYAGDTTGTLLASWSYDSVAGGKGKPASSSAYVGGASGAAYTKTVTGYNSRGETTGSSVTIPNNVPADEAKLAGTYTISHAYEPISGLPSTATYNGDGGLPAETVAWEYNQNGIPTAMGGAGDYMTSADSDPFGHLTSINLGDMPNQVVQTTHYDQATGRIIKQYIDKESGSTHVDEITNLLNPAGLVTASQDIQDGASTDVQCFGYNQLAQLTDAWSDTAGTHTAASPSVPNIGGCNTTTPSAATVGGPAPYWHSYTYNAAGNRTTFTEHATDGNPAHDVTHTSTYTGATGQGGQPDAVQSVANAGPAGNTTDSFSYDPAGNTTTRNIGGGANQIITYNEQNRTRTVTDPAGGKSASYRYDADGNLLLQRNTVGSSTKVTLYLDNEQVTLDVGTSSLSGLRYYPIIDGPTEVRSSTGALTYEFGNGQGTHSLTIDAGASQAETRRYLTPYGQERGTIPAGWVDNRAFVNQPVDPATGLNLLGARNYDPAAGRFLQLDPVLEFTDPNQLGGYSYAADNPITNTDPTGLDPCPHGGGGCGYSDTPADTQTPPWLDDYLGSLTGAGDSQGPTCPDVACMLGGSSSPPHTASGGSAGRTNPSHQPNKRPGFWRALGHDFHGLVNVGGSLAPYATVLALGTVEIPGVDVFTAGLALVADGLGTIGSAWNVWDDINNDGWGAFKKRNIYLDGLATIFGMTGFGTSLKLIARDSEAAAAEQYANDTKAQSRRASGNSKADRTYYKNRIPQTKEQARSASVAAAAAAATDKRVNLVGAAEGEGTNGYENSFNPYAVITGYSWEPLW